MKIGKSVVKLLAVMSAGLVLGGAWPSQAQEPLKVGMIQPLSGPIAAAGSYIVNGRKIELIIEDNKSDPSETRSAAEKLIVRDKVPVIIGAWGSSMTLAMMPLAAQHNVGIVVETSSSG